jgi:hypothetical protein
MMKVPSGMAIAALLATMASSANATTCLQHAKGCMAKGGDRAHCYAPDLMATCATKGIYIGPYTGSVFRANGGGSTKNKH